MSATTLESPTAFVTAAELEEAVAALSDAFNKVELVKWNLARIVRVWCDQGVVAERPTFETIGRLADFLDALEAQIAQLACYRDEIRDDIKTVMSIRADLEWAERTGKVRDAG